jgi:uncharacterized protein YutE (UPF0331/DUF86 family)
VDREVIEEKLESLRRCLQRVHDKCPSSVEPLLLDFDLQDILALNLSRAVQLCVDIGAHMIADLDVPPPETMGKTFDALAEAGVIESTLAAQLKKAVGFRNITVHNYESINWSIVHSIARNHLGDFLEFARIVTSRLEGS